MPLVVTAQEWVEFPAESPFAQVVLATPRFRAKSLTPLRRAAELRGRNRLVSHAIGVRPKRRRKTLTVVELEIWVMGDRNDDNSAVTDPLVGVQAATDFLNANLGEPVNDDIGTRPLKWHLPNGTTTRTGEVTVEDLYYEDFAPIVKTAHLRLTIPDPSWLLVNDT